MIPLDLSLEEAYRLQGVLEHDLDRVKERIEHWQEKGNHNMVIVWQAHDTAVRGIQERLLPLMEAEEKQR